jgi:hypothetical protein
MDEQFYLKRVKVTSLTPTDKDEHFKTLGTGLPQASAHYLFLLWTEKYKK